MALHTQQRASWIKPIYITHTDKQSYFNFLQQDNPKEFIPHSSVCKQKLETLSILERITFNTSQSWLIFYSNNKVLKSSLMTWCKFSSTNNPQQTHISHAVLRCVTLLPATVPCTPQATLLYYIKSAPTTAGQTRERQMICTHFGAALISASRHSASSKTNCKTALGVIESLH